MPAAPTSGLGREEALSWLLSSLHQGLAQHRCSQGAYLPLPPQQVSNTDLGYTDPHTGKVLVF